mgnify:CR=1 FL=1
MKFVLVMLLTFLMAPFASALVGGMLYAIVQNPMMIFVFIGAILLLAPYAK